MKRISTLLPWFLLQLAQFSVAFPVLPFQLKTELAVLLAGLLLGNRKKSHKKPLTVDENNVRMKH